MSVTTASTRDFLQMFALVTNPPVQIITTVSQRNHRFTFHRSSFFPYPVRPQERHLPWWLVAEGKERSVSRRRRRGSSGSRVARGSVGPRGPPQTGTAGPGWSCCSRRSGRSRGLRRPGEPSQRLESGRQGRAQEDDG